MFGLSLYTTERDLREVFSYYGPLVGVNVVLDQRTGRSRGFAFVYFERLEDSKEVWENVVLSLVGKMANSSLMSVALLFFCLLDEVNRIHMVFRATDFEESL